MRRALLLSLFLAGMAQAGSSDPGEWALENMGASDAVVRNAARRILAQAGPGVRPRLLEGLSAPGWRVREGALTVLAWSPEPPPKALLVPLAEDPAWPVRRALALLWGWHRLGRELPQRLLSDPFHDVRAAAVLALAAQPGPPAEELGRALVDRAAEVREAAWRALACAPKQLILAEIPGERGQRSRRRALRALAERPTLGQLPVLRAFLASGQATLGENLIALQAALALGSRAEGDGALVLAGLQDPSPAVRRTAVGTGLLLDASEVVRLASQGFRLSGQESWESFLKIAAPHGSALASELPGALAQLACLREGQRRAAGVGFFAAGLGGPLASKLLAEFDAITGQRLARMAALVRPEDAPGVGQWLLAFLEAGPRGKVADALIPVLMRYAGRAEVQAFFLRRFSSLPPWRQRDVAREILRQRPDDAPDALLLPLERIDLLKSPSARRDYLLALEGFPGRPRFLDLVGRLLREDPDPGVRIAALRILVNVNGQLERLDPGLLTAVASWQEASEALQRACIEVLAWTGAWSHLEALLADIEPDRSDRLKRKLVNFVRDKELSGGLPFLERWAETPGGTALARESLQALAWFGSAEAASRLVGEAALLGEAELNRLVRVLRRAPGPIALQAVETWAGEDRPEYYLGAACLLAGERPDLPVRKFLESMARGGGGPLVKAAALRALVARDERELPAALLPELVLAPPGSEEEGILAELLDAIGKGATPWAVPTLWQALLERHLRHPLQEVARSLDPSRFASRSATGRARLLSRHLYAQKDETVAAGLQEFLRGWQWSPGRALLGGDLLLSLLDETREQEGRAALPATALALARLGSVHTPPGKPLRLVSCLVLAEEAEAAGRWLEGARLFEEALLTLLLGDIDGRTQEHLMGVTEPAAGRFPIARVAGLSCLLRARADQENGNGEAAAAWIEEALARGGADILLRRQVEAMDR